MVYEEFKQKNSDFQSRIEALSSLLIPDPKLITLQSMKAKEACTQKNFMSKFAIFCDLDQSSFPLSITGVWDYCYWQSNSRFTTGEKFEKSVLAFQKTSAGFDFGNPLAARSVYLVNRLLSKKERPRFCSLWKIFGSINKSQETSYRRGYGIYKNY